MRGLCGLPCHPYLDTMMTSLNTGITCDKLLFMQSLVDCTISIKRVQDLQQLFEHPSESIPNAGISGSTHMMLM